MNCQTVEIAGITFINLNTLSKSEIKSIYKMPYNRSTYIANGIYTKVYDWKCQNISSRAGWLLVKFEDVQKYYSLEGSLEDYESTANA